MDIGTLSPDGHYQWDGEKWLPIQLLTTSEDGFWLWNGNEWIPNPLANTSPNLTPENTPRNLAKYKLHRRMYIPNKPLYLLNRLCIHISILTNK